MYANYTIFSKPCIFFAQFCFLIRVRLLTSAGMSYTSASSWMPPLSVRIKKHWASKSRLNTSKDTLDLAPSAPRQNPKQKDTKMRFYYFGKRQSGAKPKKKGGPYLGSSSSLSIEYRVNLFGTNPWYRPSISRHRGSYHSGLR